MDLFGQDGSLASTGDGGRGDVGFSFPPDAQTRQDASLPRDGAVVPWDGSVDEDAGLGPSPDADMAPSRDGGLHDVGHPGSDVGSSSYDSGSLSWDGGSSWSDGGYPTSDGGSGWGDGGHPPGDGGILTSCGNGRVESGESCDDGNNLDSDGCGAYCWVEPGYQCAGSPSTCVPAAFIGTLQPGACLTHQGGPVAAGAFDALRMSVSQDVIVHGSLVASSGDLDLLIEHIGYWSQVYSQSPGDEFFQNQWMAAGDHSITIASWLASGPVGSYTFEVCAVSFQGWTCAPQHYGTQDGCDCGCGIVDPDCASPDVVYCDYCDESGTCNTLGGCPGNIKPNDNAVCY